MLSSRPWMTGRMSEEEDRVEYEHVQASVVVTEHGDNVPTDATEYAKKYPKKRRARLAKPPLVTGPLAAEAESAGGPWISVPGWKHFSHYGDKRRAPWIKIEYAWLADYRFLRLTDHQKLALFLIWILASKGNHLPADPEWLQWRLGVSSPVDLKGLVEAGFLELHGASVESFGVRSMADRPPTLQELRATTFGRNSGAIMPGSLGPHERPIVWPPPDGEDKEPTIDERVEKWNRDQPI